jgi:hypothetical protein
MPANDQLTALDAAFLELEEAHDGVLMHIGAALMFDQLPGGGTLAIGRCASTSNSARDLVSRNRVAQSQLARAGLVAHGPTRHRRQSGGRDCRGLPLQRHRRGRMVCRHVSRRDRRHLVRHGA